MEIGTIGAGAFAQAFAKQALKVGHKVKLSNHRGRDSLRAIVKQLGVGAMAASKEEAVACEIVLLAVPWDNVPEALASLPEWNNQILIDGTNPFHGRAGEFALADVGNLSTSQLVAALAPGARVVKAFNTLFAHFLEIAVNVWEFLSKRVVGGVFAFFHLFTPVLDQVATQIFASHVQLASGILNDLLALFIWNGQQAIDIHHRV